MFCPIFPRFFGQKQYNHPPKEIKSKGNRRLKKMRKKIGIIFALLLLGSLVAAQSTPPGNITTITEPITKIYDLVKAVISILGILAITVAGGYYMFSGSNIQHRENAKSMASYAVVGLVLVWIAPLVVNYLTTP